RLSAAVFLISDSDSPTGGDLPQRALHTIKANRNGWRAFSHAADHTQMRLALHHRIEEWPMVSRSRTFACERLLLAAPHPDSPRTNKHQCVHLLLESDLR